MTLTYPVGFFGSEAQGGDATVFPSKDDYAVFDGVDDYVSSNAVITNTSSVSFWFKADAISGIVLSGIDSGVPNFYVGFSGAHLYVFVNGGVSSIIQAGVSIGRWYHVTCVLQSDGNPVTCYINGVFAVNSSALSAYPAQSGIALGRRGDGAAGQYFNGKIADVRIYNDALTADEVTYLYNRGESGADPTNANLIGHWKLDEGEGSLITDSSGNGNDGTAKNITEPAFWDKYATFDGVDDYVGTGTGVESTYDFTTFSISAWVITESSGNPSYSRGIVAKNTGTSNSGFMLGEYNSQWMLWVSGTAIQTGISWELNTWKHLVATYDGTNMRLYLNGVQIGSTTAATLINNNSELTIGKWIREGANRHWDGSIRDVRIYNDALTSNEVTYLYTAGESGTDPTDANLVARWLLNDGEGSVVADSAGSNDGTAINITEPAFWNQPHADFDGVNDYVGGTLSSINWSDYTSPFTVSQWIYIDAFETIGTFSAFTAGGSADFRVIIFLVYSNKLTMIASSSGSSWSFGASTFGTTTLVTGRWYHIAFTRNSSGVYTVYLNGVNDGSTTHTSNLIIDNATYKIGAHYALNGSYMANGKISDTRIYDDALTSSEILYLATAGEQGTDPTDANLVANWKLNDRYGTNVADSAGANDGTATNITESTFWVQE